MDHGTNQELDPLDQDQRPISSINATFYQASPKLNEPTEYTPLGSTTLNMALFKKTILNSTPSFLQYLISRNQESYLSHACDSLPHLCGSRTFLYRLFLGIVPSDGVGPVGSESRAKFIQCLGRYRELYTEKITEAIAKRAEVEQMIKDQKMDGKV